MPLVKYIIILVKLSIMIMSLSLLMRTQHLSFWVMQDPSEETRLSPWKYQDNQVILHTDTEFMPPKSPLGLLEFSS